MTSMSDSIRNSVPQTQKVNFKDKPSEYEKNKKRKNQTFFEFFLTFFAYFMNYF